MAKVLREHFIVVSDPYAVQNGVSFGVAIWTFTPERRQLRKYWWGTGNCLIGRVCTREYHDKRVREMSLMLSEVLQIAAGKLRGTEEVTGQLQQIDVEKRHITVLRGFGKEAKEVAFQLQPETRLVDGLIELKEVVPLKEGLRSELFQAGASVRIATVTDADGAVKVKEIRITGKARRK